MLEYLGLLLFHPVSSLLGGTELPPEPQVVEQLPADPSMLVIGLVFVSLLLLEAKVSMLGGCGVCRWLLSLTLFRGCHFSSFAATHPCLLPLPGLCAQAEQ